MSEESQPITRGRLRSPRAAAIAGILFSVLLTTSVVLVRYVAGITPEQIDREGLETGAGAASLAVALIPFAGLAFLWFTGVVRDWVGDREDKFFATLFFGSGILIIGLLFIWGATIGAMFGTYAELAETMVDDDVLIFGSVFMVEILGTFAIQMMGMYMLSIATLWMRTGTMPRWLTIVTFVVAIGFLLFGGRITGARFIFPLWVFFVSIYILIRNFGQDPEQEDDAFLGS